MTDEPYPAGFEEQYEVVPNDEPSLEDYPRDASGAPVKPPVKIHEGVQDTELHKGRRP